MKLLRWGERGAEKPGVIDAAGRIRDLSSVVADINGATLGDLSVIKDIERLPTVPGSPRIGACVGSVGKMICIGLNYADHAAEAGIAVPAEPIGRALTNADESEARRGIAGYCVINDLSERAWQMERGGQWVKGKSADGFGPMGPWLVTADSIQNDSTLRLWLEVDGRRYQDSSTAQMIFKPAFLASYLSQFMSLQPGDVISTGTPPGVGLGLKPPVYLRAGQVVRLGIDGLGVQTQRVVAHA